MMMNDDDIDDDDDDENSKQLWWFVCGGTDQLTIVNSIPQQWLKWREQITNDFAEGANQAGDNYRAL